MSRRIKGLSIILLVLGMLLTGCSEKTANEGTAGNEVIEGSSGILVVGDMADRNNTDVVLVMDESGSMPKADPNRFAIEGAKLFVDMEKVDGVSVALVEFSNEIKSTGLIEMQNAQSKKYFKTILEDVEYSRTAHTDTGAALLEAINVLDSSNNDNDKAILLFTDGKTDIDVGTPGRTTQDSLDDVDSAVKMAAEKGYTIYGIGLNSNGGVDEKELAKMAAATNGKYHIATNVDELRDFFNSIFAEIDDIDEEVIDEYVADGDYHETTFEIDNANVAEANIVILSSRQVEDIILTDNNGNVVDLENDDNVVFSTSRSYSLIKLITPSVGEWKIRVKGVTEDQIKIAMFYNFNINLMVETDRAQVAKGKAINIKAYLGSEGKIITEPKFYEKMTGYITAVNCDNKQVTQEALKISDDGSALTVAFYPTQATEYEITVHVEGNNLLRDSKPFIVSATKSPVTVLKQLKEVELKVGETWSIDLNECFEDENGDAITYSLGATDQCIQTELNQSQLTITANEVGSSAVTISVDNGSMDKNEYTFLVTCVSWFEKVKYVLLAALILVLLIVVLILWNESKKRIDGVFKVNITSAWKDEFETTQTHTFDIINTINSSALGKRKFLLSKLLKRAEEYYIHTAYDENQKEALRSCVQAMMAEAKKISVRGSKKAFEIKVKNSSKQAKFVEMGTTLEKKVQVINIGESKYSVSPVMEKTFAVRFITDENKYEQINITYKKM